MIFRTKRIVALCLLLSYGLTWAVFPVAIAASATKIYWTEITTGNIRRSNLDGTNVEDVLTSLSNPYSLTVDVDGEKVYWADAGTDKIQRANLDGTNVEDLVTSGLNAPGGIVLDTSGGKMYWVDFGTDKLQRANLDGSNVEDLIVWPHSLDNPLDIDIDTVNGKVYVPTGHDKIQRSNLDGTNVESVLSGGIRKPYNIALDIGRGKIYWTSQIDKKISRSNLDGSNVEDLVTLTASNSTFDIDIDSYDAKIYWTNYGENKIMRADLDGSNVEDLLTSRAYYGIALNETGTANVPEFHWTAFGCLILGIGWWLGREEQGLMPV